MRFFVGNKKSWTITAVISSVFVSIIYPQIYTTSKTTWTANFKPTWTSAIAQEAEHVADVDCSGHGRAYMDRVILPDQQHCECNNCYSGSSCRDLDTNNCTADAVTGDAMFLEKYWMQQKSGSVVLIPGWHRMSYYFDPHSQKFDSPLLDYQIRSLHASVGNANVDDNKYIVFGNGVTQLLTGLVIALSQHRSTKSADMAAKVVADVPYYPVFKKQTNYFRYKGYKWKGNASDYENTTEPENFIELVTSPNNPDGILKGPRIKGALAITDRVYYWPHYTAIDIPADDDIMLFSLSKLSGHAGSRFGWAVIKDREVYEKLTQYMVESSEGTSRDTQLRALSVIRSITSWFGPHKRSHNIFDFGYQTLGKRWRELNDLVSNSPSKRFSLQILEKKYCSYFKEDREPSPAFGWLKCEWEKEENCTAVLAEGRIKIQGGELFEASTRYVRLSLIKTDDDFDQLMEKLTLLVNVKRN